MSTEHTAEGTFTIAFTPQAAEPGLGVHHQSFTKQFTGALSGTSGGHMLATRTPVEGSAAYVVLERVQGTLDGRSGAFTLAHYGMMDRGAPSLTVQVVPDSADGELTGLTGHLQIDVQAGIHKYTLTYRLT